MNRFDRQINLPGFGVASQHKISQARVLVVGAGGLGCPVVQYLGAAGVGTICIVDGDVVATSNLNRQTLYGKAHVGMPKVNVIKEWLLTNYDDVEVVCVNEYLTPLNASLLIPQYDVVLDCTDNYQTRYMINDACVLLSKPLVLGAIYENEGQVAVFNVPDEVGICTNYRDLFPMPKADSVIPNCTETGVLGVLPGTIGMFMATQTIMLITRYGRILANTLVLYSLLTHRMCEYRIIPNNAASSHIPKSLDTFLATDYHQPCSVQIVESCTWDEAIRDIETHLGHTLIVDVRDSDEQPKLDIVSHLRKSAKSLLADITLLDGYSTVYLFCQHGRRSVQVAAACKQQRPDIRFISINGGIVSFLTDSRKYTHEIKQT